jgi:lipid II:glycine glycyltransferase (peptidoglycan interpeptide bridge formation enzyme)
MAITTSLQWDEFYLQHPHAHILQSNQWARLKSAYHWDAEHVVVGDSGAQILFRRLFLGFSIAYIPKGPIGEGWNALLPEIDTICQRHNAIFLKIEPDSWEPLPAHLLKHLDEYKPSKPVQPARTIAIDISDDEEIILARMKQKTRYNIQLAKRKEIIVRQMDDLSIFQQLMQATALRDGFGVHSQAYYQMVYDLYSPSGNCGLFLAEYQEKPLAALMALKQGKRCWYFYGASNDEERNRMPTYLLQWEAMRWAKQNGCEVYDLWGVPDADEETLEANFTNRHDGLWGVYRFKRGFGGGLMRSAGAWDKVYHPMLYWLYQKWMTLHNRSEG